MPISDLQLILFWGNIKYPSGGKAYKKREANPREIQEPPNLRRSRQQGCVSTNARVLHRYFN